MSTVSDARRRLKDRWAALNVQWSSTCEVWNDPVRQRFEKQFWSDYEQVIPQVLGGMELLSEVLEQARRNVT